jgi:glycosyltransferase involved in cell wall biosynthesis
MSSVRVLHVIGRMDPGGAELRLLELIERLSPGEFRIDVCALSGRSGALDERVVACGGAVFPIRLDRLFVRHFLRLLRRERYTVVHSHVLYSSGPILALAAAAGVPVRIAHFHSMRDRERRPLERLQDRVGSALLQACATQIIACGEGSMNDVWRTHWQRDPRCRIVYDAIDLDRFLRPVSQPVARSEIGVPVGAPMFLHVGNNAMEKNHLRLLRIFAAIRAREPSAWLVLAGAGTDVPDGPIAAGIRALGLESCVAALGVRPDVPRLMKTADVLLLPSIREGLPGVVLEACAVGLPSLATDLPGVREIAMRLPGVIYLALGESDAMWAETALALRAEAARMDLRERAADRLRSSVFHVDRAADAHRALWRGAASLEPSPIGEAV